MAHPYAERVGGRDGGREGESERENERERETKRQIERGRGVREGGRERVKKERSKINHTYLFRPEVSAIFYILQVVSYDVGLLEEEAHGVGQLVVPPYLLPLQP